MDVNLPRGPFTDTYVIESRSGKRQASLSEMVRAADAIFTISGTVSAQESVMFALAPDQLSMPCEDPEVNELELGSLNYAIICQPAKKL